MTCSENDRCFDPPDVSAWVIEDAIASKRSEQVRCARCDGLVYVTPMRNVRHWR